MTPAASVTLRGIAFGFFSLLTGLAMLAASVIAGTLWDSLVPGGTFLGGLALALAGLLACGNGLTPPSQLTTTGDRTP